MACQAVYVNKRSEKVREKLRLVIDYMPLNLFLTNDKFLFPNKKTMFVSFAKANVLSKFDQKVGF